MMPPLKASGSKSAYVLVSSDTANVLALSERRKTGFPKGSDTGKSYRLWR